VRLEDKVAPVPGSDGEWHQVCMPVRPRTIDLAMADVPTRSLFGDSDAIGPPEVSGTRPARGNGRCSLVAFEGASRGFNDGREHEFDAALREFLSP
jgi:pimeloyl-ACP methyl ester carboxylesterase